MVLKQTSPHGFWIQRLRFQCLSIFNIEGYGRRANALANVTKFVLCAGLLGTAGFCSAQTSALNPEAVAFAVQFGKAIEAVDWDTTNAASARNALELAMKPFGLRFKDFELIQPTVDIPRRMDAELSSEICISPAAWAAGLGQPIKIWLLVVHRSGTVTSPEMIAKLTSGTEPGFAAIGTMYYPPMLTQPKYSLVLLGHRNCLQHVSVSLASKL